MDDFNTFLEELKFKARIQDIVGLYTTLHQKGGSLWACCPFHMEKTPSFKLYEDTNSYYCFGCKKSGDVIKFVEEIEKMSFMEAVEFLARKYNMTVPVKKNGVNSEVLKKKRDRLYDLTREAGRYYHNTLVNDKRGKKALEYLNNRGLDMNTIETFGLGYSPNSYDIIKHLKSKGFKEEEMAEAQVIYIGNNGGYDPQHERFITPIINQTRNIVAFGGRIIEKKSDDIAKYYNSKESTIFIKNRELFGQNILKGLNKPKDAILVEGYMDVISLYQAGFHNAVASMGTSLTIEQARIIKRFVNKVYFMYDGDSAGQNGMVRGVKLLKDAGLDVYCVELEDNLDPDEYIRKYGADKLRQKIYNEAVSMYLFKIHKLEENADLKTAIGRETFARDAIMQIAEVDSPTQLESLLQYIESKTAITSMYLLEEYKKAKAGLPVEFKTNETKIADDPLSKAMRFIIYVAFGGVDNMKIEDEYYDCINNKNLLDLYNYYRQHDEVDLEDLETLKDGNVEVEKILEEGRKINQKQAKKYFDDCRKRILKTKYEGLYNKLMNEVGKADKETQEQLLNQIVLITSELNKLK